MKMAQKKHKKRKQHTKVKPDAAAVEAAEGTAEGAAEGASVKAASAKEDKKADKKAAKAAAKADKKAAKEKAKAGKKPNIFQRFIAWCKAVKTEMQRVVWPTRPELINASFIVVGAIIFFGVFIAIIDNIVVIPLNWISTLGA